MMFGLDTAMVEQDGRSKDCASRDITRWPPMPFGDPHRRHARPMPSDPGVAAARDIPFNSGPRGGEGIGSSALDRLSLYRRHRPSFTLLDFAHQG